MSQSVRAVERALDILLCFTREEPARSLTQIAESIHMSKDHGASASGDARKQAIHYQRQSHRAVSSRLPLY